MTNTLKPTADGWRKSVNDHLAVIDTSITGITAELSDLTTNIAMITSTLTDVQAATQSLTTTVAGQADELFEISSDLTGDELDITAIDKRVTVLEHKGIMPGSISLDSFGGSDDDKLAAALAYLGQQSSRPTLAFEPRMHRFTHAGNTLFNGARINFGAPAGLNTLEIAGTVPYWIEVACNGPWFDTTGQDIHSITLADLAAHYTGGAYFFRNNYATGGTAPYPINFHHMSHFGGAGGFGTYAEKCTFTQASFTGLWSTQGFTDTPYHIGGADMRLWLDSNHNIESQQTGTKPIVWCDYLSNSTFGPLYITTPKGWRGIQITGSVGTTKGCAITFLGGGVSEGHNQDTLPAYGTLFRMNGGTVVINSMKLARPMAAPNGDEHAALQLDSGNLLVNGVFYDRGTYGATNPLAWVNGGTLRIGGAQSITDEPMFVHKAGGNIFNDSSVALA